jgi:hypothetical protein
MKKFHWSCTMRKWMVLSMAIAALCLSAEASHAVKLTSAQVKNTCGTLLVHTGSHFGCKKHCAGGRTCGFACTSNGKNCRGTIVARTTGAGPKNPRVPSGNILDGGPGFSQSGPSGMGAPAGAPAAPRGPVLR